MTESLTKKTEYKIYVPQNGTKENYSSTRKINPIPHSSAERKIKPMALRIWRHKKKYNFFLLFYCAKSSKTGNKLYKFGINANILNRWTELTCQYIFEIFRKPPTAWNCFEIKNNLYSPLLRPQPVPQQWWPHGSLLPCTECDHWGQYLAHSHVSNEWDWNSGGQRGEYRLFYFF